MSAVPGAARPISSPVRNGGWRRFLLPVARHEEVGLLLLFLLVAAFFVIATPSARSASTFLDLLRDVSPNLIAAVGLTLLLLSGELDLSIGSMLALPGWRR